MDRVLKLEVLIVVQHKKEGVMFEQFAGLFHQIHGYQFKLSSYGYKSLKALLEDMKDLVVLKETSQGCLIKCRSPCNINVLVVPGNCTSQENVSSVSQAQNCPSPDSGSIAAVTSETKNGHPAASLAGVLKQAIASSSVQHENGHSHPQELNNTNPSSTKSPNEQPPSVRRKTVINTYASLVPPKNTKLSTENFIESKNGNLVSPCPASNILPSDDPNSLKDVTKNAQSSKCKTTQKVETFIHQLLTKNKLGMNVRKLKKQILQNHNIDLQTYSYNRGYTDVQSMLKQMPDIEFQRDKIVCLREECSKTKPQNISAPNIVFQKYKCKTDQDYNIKQKNGIPDTPLQHQNKYVSTVMPPNTDTKQRSLKPQLENIYKQPVQSLSSSLSRSLFPPYGITEKNKIKPEKQNPQNIFSRVTPNLTYAAVSAINIRREQCAFSPATIRNAEQTARQNAQRVPPTHINPRTEHNNASLSLTLKENIQNVLKMHRNGISIFQLQKFYNFIFGKPIVLSGGNSIKQILMEMKDVIKVEGLGVQTLLYPISSAVDPTLAVTEKHGFSLLIQQTKTLAGKECKMEVASLHIPSFHSEKIISNLPMAFPGQSVCTGEEKIKSEEKIKQVATKSRAENKTVGLPSMSLSVASSQNSSSKAQPSMQIKGTSKGASFEFFNHNENILSKNIYQQEWPLPHMDHPFHKLTELQGNPSLHSQKEENKKGNTYTSTEAELTVSFLQQKIPDMHFGNQPGDLHQTNIMHKQTKSSASNKNHQVPELNLNSKLSQTKSSWSQSTMSSQQKSSKAHKPAHDSHTKLKPGQQESSSLKSHQPAHDSHSKIKPGQSESPSSKSHQPAHDSHSKIKPGQPESPSSKAFQPLPDCHTKEKHGQPESPSSKAYQPLHDSHTKEKPGQPESPSSKAHQPLPDSHTKVKPGQPESPSSKSHQPLPDSHTKIKPGQQESPSSKSHQPLPDSHTKIKPGQPESPSSKSHQPLPDFHTKIKPGQPESPSSKARQPLPDSHTKVKPGQPESPSSKAHQPLPDSHTKVKPGQPESPSSKSHQPLPDSHTKIKPGQPESPSLKSQQPVHDSHSKIKPGQPESPSSKTHKPAQDSHTKIKPDQQESSSLKSQQAVHDSHSKIKPGQPESPSSKAFQQLPDSHTKEKPGQPESPSSKTHKPAHDSHTKIKPDQQESSSLKSQQPVHDSHSKIKPGQPESPSSKAHQQLPDSHTKEKPGQPESPSLKAYQPLHDSHTKIKPDQPESPTSKSHQPLPDSHTKIKPGQPESPSQSFQVVSESQSMIKSDLLVIPSSMTDNGLKLKESTSSQLHQKISDPHFNNLPGQINYTCIQNQEYELLTNNYIKHTKTNSARLHQIASDQHTSNINGFIGFSTSKRNQQVTDSDSTDSPNDVEQSSWQTHKDFCSIL